MERSRALCQRFHTDWNIHTNGSAVAAWKQRLHIRLCSASQPALRWRTEPLHKPHKFALAWKRISDWNWCTKSNSAFWYGTSVLLRVQLITESLDFRCVAGGTIQPQQISECWWAFCTAEDLEKMAKMCKIIETVLFCTVQSIKICRLCSVSSWWETLTSSYKNSIWVGTIFFF